jgi:hypothetical protein
VLAAVGARPGAEAAQGRAVQLGVAVAQGPAVQLGVAALPGVEVAALPGVEVAARLGAEVLAEPAVHRPAGSHPPEEPVLPVALRPKEALAVPRAEEAVPAAATIRIALPTRISERRLPSQDQA